MHTNELPQGFIAVKVRVPFMVLKVPEVPKMAAN